MLNGFIEKLKFSRENLELITTSFKVEKHE